MTFSYYSNSIQVVYRGVAADAPRLKILTIDVKIDSINLKDDMIENSDIGLLFYALWLINKYPGLF